MRLWVEPAALDEIAALPGHVRQRIRRAVSDLHKAARPIYSRARDSSGCVNLKSGGAPSSYRQLARAVRN